MDICAGFEPTAKISFFGRKLGAAKPCSIPPRQQNKADNTQRKKPVAGDVITQQEDKKWL